jgi:cell division protein ZapA
VTDERDSVTVEIFGHDYRIRGDVDPDHITEIARYVDMKMKEVAQGTPVGSLAKIGILAALNIAEELFKERNEKRRVMEDVETAACRMRRKLEEIV